MFNGNGKINSIDEPWCTDRLMVFSDTGISNVFFLFFIVNYVIRTVDYYYYRFESDM